MGEAGEFFEVPPPPEAQVRQPRPNSWEPAERVIGQEVPLAVVVSRSATVAVIVGRLTAYPNGFAFNVSLRSKPKHRMETEAFHSWRRRRPEATAPPDEVFRFGVEFGDGSLVTSLDTRAIGEPGQPKARILMGGGGGGSEARYDFSYWTSPLPPLGPITFVSEWPSEGVVLTRYEIDSEPIRNAALMATGR